MIIGITGPQGDTHPQKHKRSMIFFRGSKDSELFLNLDFVRAIRP